MRVLITGHKGYIGSILTPILLKNGYNVTGLDIDLYSNFDIYNTEYPIQTRRLDIRDIKYSDLLDFDVIIHLAALSNDPTGEFDPKLTKSINLDASIQLADKAKKAGVKRFIFSSSCSVYGRLEPNKPLTENNNTSPITEYAKSKINFENYLHKIADDNFTPIIMRNSTVYGFSPSIRMDLVVNNLVSWAYFTSEINILSDGRPWRPLIHVNDLAQIFKELIEIPKEKVHNSVINIGFNEENYRIIEIAEKIEEILPNTTITIKQDNDTDSRSYNVNFDKMSQIINYEKRWDLNKGIEQIYQNLNKGIILKEDFLDKKHTRLYQLNQYRKKHNGFFNY